MNHEFAPNKKGIDKFTQQELEDLLEVTPYSFSRDIVGHIKNRGNCFFIVDDNFNIYLGTEGHFLLEKKSDRKILIGDGTIKRRSSDQIGPGLDFWKINSISWESIPVSFRVAVRNKILTYFESLGISTK